MLRRTSAASSPTPPSSASRRGMALKPSARMAFACTRENPASRRAFSASRMDGPSASLLIPVTRVGREGDKGKFHQLHALQRAARLIRLAPVRPFDGPEADGHAVDGRTGLHIHERVHLAASRRIRKPALDVQPVFVLPHLRPHADGRQRLRAHVPAAVLRKHGRPDAGRLEVGYGLGERAVGDHVAVGVHVPEHSPVPAEGHGIGPGIGSRLQLDKAAIKPFHPRLLPLGSAPARPYSAARGIRRRPHRGSCPQAPGCRWRTIPPRRTAACRTRPDPSPLRA